MAGLPFPEYFSHVVLAELSEQGVDFTVSTPTMVAQLGPGRRDDGAASTRLFLLIGPNAGIAPPGTRRLAFVADAPAFTDGRRLRGALAALALAGVCPDAGGTH